jgi:hypothetical protein
MKIHERRTTVSRKRFPVKTTTLIRGTPPTKERGQTAAEKQKNLNTAQSTGEMLAEEEQTNENQRTAMNSTRRTTKRQTTLPLVPAKHRYRVRSPRRARQRRHHRRWNRPCMQTLQQFTRSNTSQPKTRQRQTTTRNRSERFFIRH